MRRFFRWLMNSSSQNSRRDATARSVADDDMSWFFPPNDVQHAPPWDEYWPAQIEHGLGPQLQDMFCHDDALLDAVGQRGLRTVLCVGSGISQEPHALAAAGLDVTALDISPHAMHVASELTLGDADVRALTALVARLSERGILVTHCHDGRWRPPAPPLHVVEPLLKTQGIEILRQAIVDT